MTTDTAIGGPQHRFPETRQTAIEGMAHADQAVRVLSYEAVIAAYWKPVYKYIRLRWHESNESAKDLTQSFFAHALETSALTRYDPARSAFRTYIRVAVDGHVINARKFTGRAKRCGDSQALPLETDVSSEHSPDRLFHAEWARAILELAIADVRRDGLPFRIFELYDLCEDEPRPTYSALAARFSIPITSVTNYLAAVRRDLRRAVLDRLRDLTATDREFRTEARSLLGIEI